MFVNFRLTLGQDAMNQVKEQKMNIELMDIDKVIPYARNPRINDSAVDSVVASIKEFGWQQPVVVDKENVIIAGHTRHLAARQLDMKKIPVHVATNLTPNQVKAYRLADNRVSENASWDYELLKLEFADLPDNDLITTGFSEEEISNVLDGWSADFDVSVNDGDEMEGLKTVIKIEIDDENDKEDAIDFISRALKDTSIKYEIK